MKETLTPDGNGALLTLTHAGVRADHEDCTRQGWTMVLESLERWIARHPG